MRRTCGFWIVFTGLVAAGSASAQRGLSREPPVVVDGYESQELQALREAEQRAFDARRTSQSFLPAQGGELPSELQGIRTPDLPARFDPRVAEYLRFFRDDPQGHAILAGWLKRLPVWRAEISGALMTEGVPSGLIFVAMVESGFDPRARSRAGAVGLWQLVPGTAREYGLLQDHWVDERMSPEAASRAAAQYLCDLHARFGTWELALAAYNMGYVALLRTMRKYNTNDFWALSGMEAAIPFETAQYVAKILACAIIANNTARFGFGDVVPDASADFEVVEAPAGTPLDTAARAAGLANAQALARLNPELRRGRVPPGSSSWPLRVPRAAALEFGRNLARLLPEESPHRVIALRFGEELSDVAARFSTTTAALRELNDLRSGDRLEFGTPLLVPNRHEAESAAREPRTVFVPSREVAAPARIRVFYSVRSGDRLQEIASFFRVTPALLRDWNGLDERAELQAGMTLQIFPHPEVDLSRALVLRESEVRVLTVGSEEFLDWHEQQRGRVRVRIHAQEGDTLASLAERHGSTAGSLARINRLSPRAPLRAGQEIIVYQDASGAAESAQEGPQEGASLEGSQLEGSQGDEPPPSEAPRDSV